MTAITLLHHAMLSQKHLLHRRLRLAIERMPHFAFHAEGRQRILEHQAKHGAVRRIFLRLAFDGWFVFFGGQKDCERVIGAGMEHW